MTYTVREDELGLKFLRANVPMYSVIDTCLLKEYTPITRFQSRQYHGIEPSFTRHHLPGTRLYGMQIYRRAGRRLRASGLVVAWR